MISLCKHLAKVYLQVGGYLALVVNFKDSLMKEISKRNLEAMHIYCVLITGGFWALCKGILL